MEYDNNLSKTLAELDAQINGPSRMQKALDDVRDDVDGLRERMDVHHARDRDTDADHDQQLAELRQAVVDLRRQHVSAASIKTMLSRIWDDLHQALDEEGHQESDEASANKALTKAAASYLDEHSSRADATRVVSWLVKSFGRRGGKIVNYNKELAGRLLLSKSISTQEHKNWKKYGRLPDDVTLQSAGRAQPAADQAMLTAHALAGMNVSPLALQYYAMRQR
jgi:hypothetical protein